MSLVNDLMNNLWTAFHMQLKNSSLIKLHSFSGIIQVSSILLLPAAVRLRHALTGSTSVTSLEVAVVTRCTCRGAGALLTVGSTDV